MTTFEEKFRAFVDPKKPRGRRRRQILNHILENPSSSQIEIARGVYGPEKAKNSYKSLRIHLRRFKGMGLINISGGKTRKVSLTRKGEDLCKAEGVDIISKTTKEFIRVLNGWVLTNPLTPAEETRAYGLLSDKVIQILFSISSISPLAIPNNLRTKYRKLKPQLDVWGCLRGLWVYESDYVELAGELVAGRKRILSEIHTGFEAKPLSVSIVELSDLKQKFSELRNFIEKLALKNPTFSELRNRAKMAYHDFKTSRSQKRERKRKRR